MKAAVSADDDELIPLQRDMIDFAHRVDPELAASLVAQSDTDPARIRRRLALSNHLEVLKTTKRLADRPKTKSNEEGALEHYPKAAWRLLGQLNAGLIQNRKQEDMREFAKIASTMPFSEAYPILSWVVGNAVHRFSDTDQATTILRPMFESILIASQIAARMANQNTRAIRDARSVVGRRILVGLRILSSPDKET